MDDIIEPLGQTSELTREEGYEILKMAIKINLIRDPGKRQLYIIALLRENIVLLKELNEARRALGLDPLPVVDNSKARIA